MTENSRTTGIVWLASYPRSGNTWTRHFLHNLFAVMDHQRDKPHDINGLGEYTLWDIAAQRFEKAAGKPVAGMTRAEIAAVRASVQRRIADEASGPVFVKTHNALVMDRGHATISMAATSGAIYIVRNPLDVAISFAAHFGIGLDDAIERMGRTGLETEVGEHVVHEVYGSWSENVASWTRKPHRAILVVRYEDLLAKPLETFARLANHLLLSPSPDQLAEAIALSSFEKLQEQERTRGYVERPKTSKAFFREGRAAQWRTVLDAAQIDRVAHLHREQMARFGYLPDGNANNGQ